MGDLIKSIFGDLIKSSLEAIKTNTADFISKGAIYSRASSVYLGVLN